MSDRRGNKSLPNSGNFSGSSSKKNRPDKARSSDNQVNGGGRSAKSHFTLAQIVSGAHLNSTGSKKPSRNQPDQSKKMATSNPGQATDSETHKFNAEVCKRMDPEFSRILKVASQVAIFDYDCQAKKWASKDILGCLFFYERKAAPRYGLSILNRKSLNNFVLLLKPDMQLQVEEPHILIRDDETINCLWFYNRSECDEIAEEVNRRQKKNLEAATAAAKPQEQVVPQQSSQDQSGNQILNILCQKLMASSVGEAKTNTVPDPVVFKSQPPMEQTGSSTLQALLGLAPNTAGDNAKATTEQPLTGTASGQPPKKFDSLGDELRATLGIINKLDSSWQPEWNVDNGGFDGDNAMAGNKTLQNFGEQRQPAYGNLEGYFQPPATFTSNDIHNPQSAFVKTVSLHSYGSRNTGGYNNLESTSICGSANELHSTALNKEQMLRAFSYLLDTDPDFTERLHQAYLRSFERA